MVDKNIRKEITCTKNFNIFMLTLKLTFTPGVSLYLSVLRTGELKNEYNGGFEYSKRNEPREVTLQMVDVCVSSITTSRKQNNNLWLLQVEMRRLIY